MENLPVNNGNGQAYGYTLYETIIITGGFLKSGHNIKDRALVSAAVIWICICSNSILMILVFLQVFVNQSFIGIFYQRNMELAVSDDKVYFSIMVILLIVSHLWFLSVFMVNVQFGEICWLNSMYFKEKRTLSLLIENCGRVHYGKDMDDQRKGIKVCLEERATCLYSVHSWVQRFLHKVFVFLDGTNFLKHMITIIVIQNLISGIVGDILLNNVPLRDFTIYSLDMTSDFFDRFVLSNFL